MIQTKLIKGHTYHWWATRCAKEVGSPQRGWHGCQSKGTIAVPAKFGGGPLMYCTKHAPR